MPEFDYSPFWTFGDAWTPGAVRVLWTDWTPDRSQSRQRLQWTKDVCSGRLIPEHPLPFQQKSGRVWSDWIGSDFLFALVSERFAGVLRKLSATGWGVYPVQLLARDGSSVSGYHGFSITSTAEAADHLSQAMIRPPDNSGGSARSVWRGLYWKPETWDGSDIFRVAGQLVCTERVYAALVAANLKNVACVRVTEWEREWSIARRADRV